MDGDGDETGTAVRDRVVGVAREVFGYGHGGSGSRSGASGRTGAAGAGAGEDEVEKASVLE